MGAFYTNVTVRGREQQAVVDHLRQQGLTAYVSPTAAGCTVVYERESDEQREAPLVQLASRLSAALDCVALAVLNHDDDVLCYWLCEGGTLLDTYNSAPGYFTGRPGAWPAGGDASLLCRAFGAEDHADEVAAILRARGQRSYLFASDRHQALVQALGLPILSAGLGFEYVSRGEARALLGEQEMAFVGSETGGAQDIFAGTYGNITLCSPDRAAIAAYLEQNNLRAYLSPTVRGCTVVYEEHCDRAYRQGIALLANRLSASLACTALAVHNLENSRLWYRLYVAGLLIDEHESGLGWVQTPGSARLLCEALGVGHKSEAVAVVLASFWTRYNPVLAHHRELVDALELPGYSVGVGYRLLASGKLPRPYGPGDFQQVTPRARPEDDEPQS